MTTVGTMTATRTAAVSGEIEPEKFAIVADGGDAVAVALESLVSIVLVTDAARETLATTRNG